MIVRLVLRTSNGWSILSKNLMVNSEDLNIGIRGTPTVRQSVTKRSGVLDINWEIVVLTTCHLWVNSDSYMWIWGQQSAGRLWPLAKESNSEITPPEMCYWSENFFRRAELKFRGYWIRVTRNARVCNARSSKVGSSHCYLDRRPLRGIDEIVYGYDKKRFSTIGIRCNVKSNF